MNEPTPIPLKRADVSALADARRAEPDLQLIDVRSAGEYGRGHVPGAVNMPLGRVDPGALDRARPVWTICRSGARSARAGAQLAAAGFDVTNVDGGTLAWTAAGHPVDRLDGPPDLRWPALAVVTLGLMPYSPEPHIFGKVRWLLGGADGMAGADWFDLALHGAPWLWLAWALIARLRFRARG